MFVEESRISKSGKRKIWAFIFLYISFIYLTLPLMRPALNILYASIGRDAMSAIVNGMLMLIALIISVYFYRRGPIRFLMVAIPLAVLAVFAYSLNLPEERVHFLEYGFLGFLFISAFGTRKRYTAFSLILLFLIGYMDEFLQFLLPDRVGDVRDVIMNTAGGALGLWVGRLFYW